MRFGLWAPVLAVGLASVTAAGDAEACGGCFVPPDAETVVTGHRMALSISPAQTVLWDQIQYTGDPAEFAWVLPVKPGAFIEVATDAWFETLEAATATGMLPPQVGCHDDFDFNPGCGASDSFGGVRGVGAFAEEDGAGVNGGPAVEVIHRGTVGPYEEVTLSTTTPGALNAWLTEHSYNIDETTQPLIDAYVAEGFDFIALRLQPDKGVREMKPVRVVAPGAGDTLPLRMVAIGTGANVAITLFVIAEGRFAAKNFPNVEVPLDLTAWDFETNSSNYAELRALTLKGADGGSAWLTTFAKKGPLLSPVEAPNGFFGTVRYGVSAGGTPLDTIAEAYLNQSILNGEVVSTPEKPVDLGSCFDTFTGLEGVLGQSSEVIANPCPMGAPLDSPDCAVVKPGETDARALACGGATDLAAALIGMHPRDVWLTRLEADLPQAALKADLNVTAAASQTSVENFLRARIAVNADKLCGSFVPPPVWSSSGGRGMHWGLSLGGLVLAAAVARRLLARAT
jgi:hypothetical protein